MPKKKFVAGEEIHYLSEFNILSEAHSNLCNEDSTYTY